MRWSDVPFRPSDRTLRQFAGLWLAVFGGLAIWQGVVRDNTTGGLVLGTLAITVGPLGLVLPRAVRPLFVGWMIAVWPVGWVVSHLLLAALFYGVFTPLALFFRLVGRDALCRRYVAEAATYWTPQPATSDVRQYFRQY